MKTKNNTIYVVEFRGCIDELPEATRTWYFSSVAAIYEKFTVNDIGCDLHNLWNNGVAKGKVYTNAKVKITKQTIHAKKQHKNGL